MLLHNKCWCTITKLSESLPFVRGLILLPHPLPHQREQHPPFSLFTRTLQRSAGSCAAGKYLQTSLANLHNAEHKLCGNPAVSWAPDDPFLHQPQAQGCSCTLASHFWLFSNNLASRDHSFRHIYALLYVSLTEAVCIEARGSCYLREMLLLIACYCWILECSPGRINLQDHKLCPFQLGV